ncbi:DMT family transporter [Ruegeria sp. PrR005]|uniref:DMT family transporter n=1 Tax=Ruegeria sp. PrR005 TaxID=2706882 RepID=A0A6B2NLI9_9RHOB|nr:DMT family transporter [Ruegeria sp. PrR005]NDW43559.1 DMT family transporter [Ruegeria sp. PrR005]
MEALAGRQDRAGLGMVMMLAAWFMFACTDSSVKWLVLGGLGAFQLAFARYGVALILSVISMRHRAFRGTRLTPRQIRLLLLRAVLLVTSTISNFVALRYLSLTMTAAIMFSSPIIVSALAVPLLGEKIGPWRWFAIGLGFVGVLCVVRPFGAGFHWASALIVYNATALALFSIITRKLSGEVATQVMQIWAGAMGTLVLLPLAIWSWQPISGALTWALYLAIGAFAWTGHEIFARAHRYADVSLLMPFSYSYLVYMAGAGWLLFGALPDGMTLVGAGIIVVSGLIIWWRENRPGGAT